MLQSRVKELAESLEKERSENIVLRVALDSGEDFNQSKPTISRRSKRMNSMAQFNKKTNLTLQIEEIEKDMEDLRASKADNQEDSPIREARVVK